MRWIFGLLALVSLLAPGPVSAAGTSRTLDPNTRFFVPFLPDDPLKQIIALLSTGNGRDASLIIGMEAQARAVWFTKGTPSDVNAQVRQTMALAQARRQVPVLVAYNIPGRDCANLSAGGATTTAEYKAWIDAFAAGIGSQKAVVILEPDGLGLLPTTNCGGPTATYPFTDDQRFVELNYAVDRLAQQPNALVYLDGTHSHWLAVGDISIRLNRAGVMRAQGFYLNVSNFRATRDLDKFGTWISECFAFANNPADGGWRLGHYDWCASQYFSPNGPVSPDDFSTWHFTDEWYAANLGTATPTMHFVVDTSRNGQGPWTPPAGKYKSNDLALDWCNPPGRGLGLLSSARTNVPLLDAYLWIKVPGESDGTCNRTLADGQVVTLDPEWGVTDPAAGKWFPQQALQLAKLAKSK